MKHFLDTIYSLPTVPEVESMDMDRKDTLILVPDEAATPLATALFSKMFGKLGLEVSKEAIILSLQDGKRRFTDLRDRYGFKRLILCGVSPGMAGLQSACPQHVPMHLGTLFILRTDTPSRLESGSVEFKSAFWQAFRSAYTND